MSTIFIGAPEGLREVRCGSSARPLGRANADFFAFHALKASPMTPMNLSCLDDFLALAASGNFSRAADERHMTQPAFSRRIRALEE
ncbi:LysR family transcriptional regulator [Aromatoleum sp.]|uniref:LysR family transcriptional regulator n=1 Tax=Aromatoleum sp. TaxID=2307007 RepID=UPI002FCC3096